MIIQRHIDLSHVVPDVSCLIALDRITQASLHVEPLAFSEPRCRPWHRPDYAQRGTNNNDHVTESSRNAALPNSLNPQLRGA